MENNSHLRFIIIKITGSEIESKLRDHDLKVTPQRMAILKAIYKLNNHPIAEQIIENIRKIHPDIASGTVY